MLSSNDYVKIQMKIVLTKMKKMRWNGITFISNVTAWTFQQRRVSGK